MKAPLHFRLQKQKKLETMTEEQFLGLKTEMEKDKSLSDQMADMLTKAFGTVIFLTLNALFFLVWIVLNMGIIPGIPAFDPFPYGLLTMIVSLEAIFLSIIVLISQNRASDIADLREELDLLVNVRAEQEITRILKMLDAMCSHLGICNKNDKELKEMKETMNLDDLKEKLISELHPHHNGNGSSPKNAD